MHVTELEKPRSRVVGWHQFSRFAENFGSISRGCRRGAQLSSHGESSTRREREGKGTSRRGEKGFKAKPILRRRPDSIARRIARRITFSAGSTRGFLWSFARSFSRRRYSFFNFQPRADQIEFLSSSKYIGCLSVYSLGCRSFREIQPSE